MVCFHFVPPLNHTDKMVNVVEPLFYFRHEEPISDSKYRTVPEKAEEGSCVLQSSAQGTSTQCVHIARERAFDD